MSPLVSKAAVAEASAIAAPPNGDDASTGFAAKGRHARSEATPSNGPHASHIAFVLPGLDAGGSEHIVSLLCNHFAGLGWTVTLLSFGESSSNPYYDHDPAVRIRPLGLAPRRRGRIGAVAAAVSRWRRLQDALATARPDLVVSFLTRTNVLSVLAARPLGVPVLVSERNNPALQRVGPVWGSLRRWAYPRVSGLVTMTDGAMRYFTDRMRVNGWVIPNPASLPTDVEERESDGRTIGAVGRLVPQKGFDLLLDAFARAAPAMPGWRLVIWGEGPERAALEAQRLRLGLGNRIDLPGVTSRPGEWIRRSDLFVLSSRFEGWGLVVGEAMAAGLPVIAFDCDWGPAEMIEDGSSGVLVRSGDVGALGEAMIALCGDQDLRERLGRQAAQRMRRFAPEQVLAQWEGVITDVLDLAGRGLPR